MVLQKLSRPSAVEPLAHLPGGLDHIGEFTSGAGSRSNTSRPAPRALGRAIPRMQFEPADLRHRGQALDAVDLQIRLSSPETFTSSSRFDVPGMAWRWKNFSPAMPSGARTIEHGRPLRWRIIQSPTASK